ncbi:aldehyde dehydrogenase family protein [Amycolatopsis sp. H6(2020)]|nr:aldehyde dehydrogenase family protein [Amycolatopsis sp. H6(2020)]
MSGRHLKPSVLELGGKNPPIVLPDADLSYAADAAAFGAFANNGQACMAADRIDRRSFHRGSFVDLLAERANSLRVGDPTDATTQIGPLADPAARQRVRRLIDDARVRGATAAAGGTNDGSIFSPTVVAGPDGRPRRGPRGGERGADRHGPCQRLRRRGRDVLAPTLAGLGERASLLDPETGLRRHVDDVVVTAPELLAGTLSGIAAPATAGE